LTVRTTAGPAATILSVETIFDVAWNALTLEHVAGFLAAADAEPLLWEAKGDRLDEHLVRKTVCAFANSHDGGYLILGADEVPGQGFVLNGLAFPDEPPLWISTVVRAGVRPWPGVDAQSFAVEEGRHVAVVWTPPLATPPCISRGTVYERIPGASPVVRDPARLAELYRRGDAAHTGAQGRAARAALWLLADLDEAMDSEDLVGFVLGVSATGFHSADIGARLFTPTFEDAACRVVDDLPSNEPPPLVSTPTLPSWAQDAITLRRDANYRLASNWTLRASWDGAVAVGWRQAVETTRADYLAEGPLGAGWRAAVDLLEGLGGTASHYLIVQLLGRQFADLEDVPFDEHPRALPTLRRGPLSIAVEEAQLSSIEHEIRRVLGERSYEA
jgi:hypothetical protein